MVSEFYDMAASLRENEEIARQHARRREHESTVESLDLAAMIIAGFALAVLWAVLR